MRRWPEAIAQTAFVLLHIPLVAGLLWLTKSEVAKVKHWSRIAVAALLATQDGVHKRLDHLPLYIFEWLITVTCVAEKPVRTNVAATFSKTPLLYAAVTDDVLRPSGVGQQ